MLFQAATDLGLDLARSALIGDKMSDIKCVHAAHIGFAILVDPGALSPISAAVGHEIARDLVGALALLLRYLVTSRSEHQ
jgi:histidinol phosphatase-like enzyme